MGADAAWKYCMTPEEEDKYSGGESFIDFPPDSVSAVHIVDCKTVPLEIQERAGRLVHRLINGTNKTFEAEVVEGFTDPDVYSYMSYAALRNQSPGSIPKKNDVSGAYAVEVVEPADGFQAPPLLNMWFIGAQGTGAKLMTHAMLKARMEGAKFLVLSSLDPTLQDREKSVFAWVTLRRPEDEPLLADMVRQTTDSAPIESFCEIQNLRIVRFRNAVEKKQFMAAANASGAFKRVVDDYDRALRTREWYEQMGFVPLDDSICFAKVRALAPHVAIYNLKDFLKVWNVPKPKIGFKILIRFLEKP